MRSSEITGRPVVTMAGHEIAQIKDIVYSSGGGTVAGFTLAGRGLFAGPLKQGLSWSAVAALGAAAVMVADEAALGSRILTDSGTERGAVVDVVLEVDGDDRGVCDVVGYEIESSEVLDTGGSTLLIPLPDTLAASGEHLMVPASATDFVRRDLAGFGAAVADFRAQLAVGR